MTDSKPRIVSLEPIVFPDNRRVMFDLTVENLPVTFGDPNFIGLDMLDSQQPRRPTQPPTEGPSPYPNIELSILDSNRQEVTSLLIVEHKEQHTSLTLHLRTSGLAGPLIARAEMTHEGEIWQVVEVPFTLNPAAE